MRVIEEQRNVWGSASPNGQDAQRSDLWVVDLRQVIDGINSVLSNTFEQLEPVGSFYAQSVALPTLQVKADQVRRDSRPYNMPTWDEPPGETRLTFILDARVNARHSRIYTLLDRWRMLVRAGRGQMGTEAGVNLDEHYRITYAFALPIKLLRGSVPNVVIANIGWQPGNDLELSGEYLLEKAWLSSFKMGDLSYEGSKTVMLEATIFAENFADKTGFLPVG